MKTYHGFNVGDRVVRLEGFDHGGRTGTVIEWDEDTCFVYVKFDDGHRFGSYPDRIRLIDNTEFEVDEDFT